MSPLSGSSEPSSSASASPVSRRSFLRHGSAGAAALALGPGALFAGGAHVSGRDEIRVGLVGCGRRGGGAAVNALRADPGCRLVAMGDVFADQAERKRADLLNVEDVKDRVRVDDTALFSGFDAYRHVIDACDVVCLAAAPHFRPRHLRYAIERGKHVFCEKPVAVDAPGVRSILETNELARQKGLSIVSGLCWRYADTVRETMARVHDGAIGTIRALEVTYHANGLWHSGDDPAWSRLEWQIRNWVYFTWLGGDVIAEQHIHSLDKALWAMRDVPPARASGVGGRQQRTDPKFGNVWDHFAVIYEWEDGTRAYSSCRQWDGCQNDVSDRFFGTEGLCDIGGYTGRIRGAKEFSTGQPRGNMYQLEHDALFAAVREGKPIHDGGYMAKSTLMAILGRQAAYTGKTLSWRQMLASEQVLGPETYEWADIDVPDVAVPGHTRFF